MMTIEQLQNKADWVRRETLRIHKIAPATRVASSLSSVEMFTALYYGGLLKHNPQDIFWPDRDRIVVSKGHGSICLYPILADRGYFPAEELERTCQPGGFLGAIPDTVIPGIETTNGSLGHGLSVACGIAIALKRLGRTETVYTVIGDGELFEGSVWEAVMFAGEHKLDNLIAIIDNNKISMLDYCRNIVDLSPLEEKFGVFNWAVESVDGHSMSELMETLTALKGTRGGKPKMLIANTVKGKGVPALENDKLCHLRTLSPEEVDQAIERLP